MRDRLPLILSATALAVAVLGTTPLGEAALDAVPVPLAKRAYLADTAKNAVKVNNIRANRTPTAGQLLPLDQAGKFPASVGAIGPKGDKGDKGSKGDKGLAGEPGVSAYGIVQGPPVALAANSTTIASVACPAGKNALGGGGSHASSVGYVAAMGQSIPKPNTNGTAWQVSFKNLTSTPAYVTPFVVCAIVR